MRLKIEPIDAAAFMPFGQLLPPQAPGQGRQELFEKLQNERASARPRLSMATVEPKALPLTAAKMERHVHSSQVFVPVDSAGYSWSSHRMAPTACLTSARSALSACRATRG